MSDADHGVTGELVEAFIRLARGDFTVRLPRNFQRDQDDLLAYFVNLIAEELDRIIREREAAHRVLEAGIATLGEAFLRLAAGDFAVRVPRTERGDPMDVLAFLLNNTAAEVGDAFGALERERGVVASILDAMVDGVLLLAVDGTIQRANPAIERMLGVAPGALVGAAVGAILAPREADLAERLGEVVGAGPLHGRDVLFRAADGAVVALTVTGSATRAGDGAVTGAVLVARDDRELKQAQARVRMSDRLAGVGTIAAGVAHELNNPLAFVLANLDFALEELEDVEDDDGHLGADRLAELLRALVATRQGAQRMRQIVRDLKTLSRVDLEANSTIALPPVVDSALNMLRNEIRHHARLVRQYQQIPTVRGNEGRLVQVFVNLIQNAAQAMPAGRADDNEIRVSCTTAADGAAVVEIQDTGDGIADADLPRIFDAFYTTKAAGIGTGLGLSISHEIVTGLGGRIEVASVVGRGTTFRVVLPPATRPGAHPSPHATPNDGSRRLRLLVVDDEPEIGHAAVRTLGRDHDVVVVHRGADALRLVAHERFDAILCDVMMPEMTGVELLDRLQVGHPELVDRVVFMTGGAFSPGAAELLARSARPRIDKPFDLDEVRRVLGAVAAAAGAE